MTWLAILLGAAGCYALKLGGLAVPDRVLDHPGIRRVAALLPVALLAALVATQTLTSGSGVVLDARAAGVGVAVLAVLSRAPFLVVVASAAATTALLRMMA